VGRREGGKEKREERGRQGGKERKKVGNVRAVMCMRIVTYAQLTRTAVRVWLRWTESQYRWQPTAWEERRRGGEEEERREERREGRRKGKREGKE
jgi:hypothetical protein